MLNQILVSITTTRRPCCRVDSAFIGSRFSSASGVSLIQALQQAIGVERRHGLVVLGADHHPDHAVVAHHAHGLALRPVEELADPGLGFIGTYFQ